MRNKLLLLICLAIFTITNVVAQTGTIRGTVIDDKGLPVPFANVSIEQAGSIVTGTTTDFDGVFKVKALKPASNYYVKASSVGFTEAARSGVVVSSDEIVMVDFTLTTGVKLDEVVVTEHKVPLVKQDGGASQVFTSENVTAMATRGVAGVATMVGGVQEDDNGGIGSIRGARDDGGASFIYIDGVKVRGSSAITQAATAEVKVFTGGIPAKYGDASGGIISITTKGAAETTHGGLEILTSGFDVGNTTIGFDKYNFNLLAANLTGPLIRIKDKSDPEGKKKRSVVGYFLAAELRYQKDRDPSAIGMWKVKDDVLDNLRANPVRRNPIGGTDLAAEFISGSQMELVDAKQNTPYQGIVANANFDFVTTPNITLKLGGSIDHNVRNEFSFNNSMFNYDNNIQDVNSTWRVFGRYTQRFNKKDIDPDNPPAIMNALYSIQVDYSNYTRTRQDDSHKDDLFNYGYVGKFVTYREPTYQLGFDDSLNLFGWLQGPYNDTLIEFTGSDINPNLSAYTEQYYGLFPDAEGNYENLTQIEADRGALRNGDAPDNVYGLWRGSGYQGNEYSKFDQTQFRIAANGSVDIKNHSISLGFEYEQRVDSRVAYAPVGLWTLGRQLTNGHLANLDLDNGIVHLDDQGSFSDTISYNPSYAPGVDGALLGANQSYFDYNLRQSIGLDGNGLDFLYLDSMNPENLQIDWFSADELLNNGNAYVSYFGYDHAGNKTSGTPTFEDFFTETDDFGNLTRAIGAFRPIYMAGYIEDEFSFKDLIFRVGVRVDRFDANQKVLKDPYLFKEALTAAEVDYIHPENIGDDFVVYGNNLVDPDVPVGYRDGDTWYNSRGDEITDPSALEVGGNIAPWLRNKPGTDAATDDILESGAFKDFVPQVNVMPRVSFSFPISKDANFYANYDVLTERPTGRNRLDLVSYLFVQNDNDRLNNPDLKPTKTIEYSVGFKQKLSKNSAIHLNAFYREVRDQIQVIRLAGAYPTSYTTFGNIDFGTVKGLTVSYDMRRTKRFQMRLAYTLQFADGTGSNDETGLNLVNAGFPNLRIISPYDYDQRHRLVLNADYRFNSGTKYKGPKTITKGGKTINWLQSFGANLTVSANSGSPYTRQSNANARALISPSGTSQIQGGINGSARPWQYRLDLKVERDFNFGGKEKEKNGVKVKGFESYLNVYVQILNLLNTANVISVYRKTGNADDDGYLSAASNQVGIAAQTDEQSYRDQYSIKVNNPNNYSTPRQIRLGIAWNF
jgi:outer membrane receptor protein involved in Fe transport